MQQVLPLHNIKRQLLSNSSRSFCLRKILSCGISLHFGDFNCPPARRKSLINGIERAAGTTPDTARAARLQKALQRARKHALGTPFSDFEMVDSTGAKRMFSSLVPQDKPVLVDIWASWCGPCRSAIPKVRALHEKYGDKLDILSISVDEKRTDWIKAMQEEQMPWSQWLVPSEQMGILADKYGVEFIPFVFVVHEGKIAAFGHPKTLDAKIARMIGEINP